MTISDETRSHSVANLRRWFDLAGVEQIHRYDPRAGRWQAYAKCGDPRSGVDPDSFFSDEADTRETYQAQAVCLACPVRQLCDDAATARKAFGVNGGIYRHANGQEAALCEAAGCLSYRLVGKPYCRSCTAAGAGLGRVRPPVLAGTEVIAA